MSIQSRVREWLGITTIKQNQVFLSQKLDSLDRELRRANTQLSAVLPGLGRVIAKLDTQYARSEFDPQRIAESKKLEEETIRRLQAEAAAREPYNY